MSDEPQDMMERLKEYVDELEDARKQNRQGAIKGRTQMIPTVLEKLRMPHKAAALPSALIDRIQKEKNRAYLQLPETYSDYISICWDCYKRKGGLCL